jgi:hypothetical protein
MCSCITHDNLYCDYACQTCPNFYFFLSMGASTPPFISKKGEVTNKVIESVIT